MSRFLPFFLSLFTLVPSLVASNLIQGTVYQRKGSSTAGLPKTFVSARSALNGQLLAVIRTGRGGLYQLRDLPATRMVLTAFRPGYYTRLAAGRTSAEIHLDCSAGCGYSGVDFELVRGAVVRGRVVDGLGEPVEGALVTVAKKGGGGGRGRAQRSPVSTTDDRGVFRVAGLGEGAHVVRANSRRSGASGGNTVLGIRLAEGEQPDEITLVLGSSSSYRVAGTVTGVDTAELPKLAVRLHSMFRSGRPISSAPRADGRFEFRSVPAGEYRISAVTTAKDNDERSRPYHLGVIKVEGDRTGLVVRPLATGTAQGTLRITSGRTPPWLHVFFQSNDGLGKRGVRVDNTEPRFQVSGLVPGSYRIQVSSSDLYIKGVTRTGDPVPANKVAIAAGENTLEIILAGDPGRVYGTIREPGAGRRPLPLARVAIKGSRGLRSGQADQTGRFQFDKVVPGEYQICAWADISPEVVADQGSWEEAGCSSKTFPVGAESDVEIDLTAAL